MKYFTDQELEEALGRAPKPIQDEMTSSNTIAEVVASIGHTLNLHIDIVGAIVQLSVYMLLGLINPQEFSQELTALGLSEAQIKEIMSVINQKIFVPLHEQMRSGGGGVAPPSAPRPVNIPIPNYYAPPPQSPSYFHLKNKIPPPSPLSTIAPLPPKVVLPQSGNQSSINQFDNRMMPPPPAAETPLQQALRTVLPPANLPGAIVPPDIIPPAKKTPPPAPYSTDPYREPVQ